MTAPQQFLTETRERFLKTILAKVPAAQVRELYLFQPIRQGGVESGVAVVAAYDTSADGSVSDDGERPTVDGSASADGERPTANEKYTVYTARYRHTLKGPDRGKWEASIVAEAEAPLLSIESVVRGVQRRAGDVDPPDRMTAADLRSALRLDPARGEP